MPQPNTTQKKNLVGRDSRGDSSAPTGRSTLLQCGTVRYKVNVVGTKKKGSKHERNKRHTALLLLLFTCNNKGRVSSRGTGMIQ